MNKTIKKIGIGGLLFVLAVIAIFSFSSGSATVKADSTIESCLSNITIVGMNKSEEETTGKSLFINVFVPTPFNLTDDYTFGTVVFPELYLSQYEVSGNYINEFTAKNVRIMNITGNVGYDVTGGYLYRFGLLNILEQNMDRIFCFIFYLQDKTTNEAVYSNIHYAAYNTMQTDGSIDLSGYRTQFEYNTKVAELQSQIDDLTESITENGVDLTNYKTLAEYNAKVAELQAQINKLNADNDELKIENEELYGVQDKVNNALGTKLSVVQIIGLLACVILVVFFIAIFASKSWRNRD